MKSRSVVVLAILGMATLTLSCSDDKSTNSNGGEQDSYLPRTSPENLLENLLLAYKHRDVAQFNSLLDEEFVFHFSEEDQDIGVRLLRAAEIPIHDAMFGPDYIQNLTLSYHVDDITLDEERTTPADSVWVATLSNVDLYLFGKFPQFPDEDPWGFQMENGRERFWFHRSSEVDPDSGEPVWTIIEWRELGFRSDLSASPSVASTSWGEIKALFGPWHGPFLQRTSPENLLRNLLKAYELRDVAEFDSLLDRDFVFFFSEEDQDIGERLERSEEIPIHDAMFGPDYIQNLTLSYHVDGITLDEERTTPADSVWVATLSNVDLYLYGKTPQFPYEDPRAYEMENGAERFWFHRTSWTDPYMGEPIWTIVEWLEGPGWHNPGALPASDATTWGAMKALFH
jgi:ketosteroid isomerase-like protein